ncbi:MAG: sigma-54 dependent transcriptional regulator [Gemmatimonadaceae bacterium]
MTGSPVLSHGPTTVLLVDDESGILDSLRILLRTEGFLPVTAKNGRQGIELLASVRPDVVLTDVRMPDVGGLQLLSAARQMDPELPVILMTAQATLQSAMQAVNDGAFYYLQKPFRNDELIALLHRAAEHRRLRRENAVLKQEIRRQERRATPRPVGGHARWLEVLALAERVAPTDATVLITGESGTGKEVIARYVHAHSGRAAHPFLSINCGALPESLLESELFGHMKGAFTGAVKDKTGLFAAAQHGSFFLDEIGDTMLSTQVKLLRALQQREVIPVGATEAITVDTRVIAATNRDLEEEIKRGRFRADLFYRLNVIAIHLPPLRDRVEDIPVLAEAFLARSAAARGEAAKLLREDTLALLCQYGWPGNVRELEHALERAVILSPDDDIAPEALPTRVTARHAEPLITSDPPATPTLEAIERAYIHWVLHNEGGNKSRAAEMLGIDPSTLYRKLARYGEP